MEDPIRIQTGPALPIDAPIRIQTGTTLPIECTDYNPNEYYITD